MNEMRKITAFIPADLLEHVEESAHIFAHVMFGVGHRDILHDRLLLRMIRRDTRAFPLDIFPIEEKNLIVGEVAAS